MRPPRVGRAAFAAGSFLAFVPATALGMSDALSAASSMASRIQIPLPDESGGIPDLDVGGLSLDAFGSSGTSLPTMVLTAVGWAAFGWLAAGRCRDIGDEPAIAWLTLPVALAFVVPGSPWWLAAVASLAVTAWSLRLGTKRGKPPVRRPQPVRMAARPRS